MMNLFLLQIQANQAMQNEAAGKASEVSLSYWELAIKGGWVMVPIVLLSVIAIYIFIERFFIIKMASKEDINFMNRIKDLIYDDKVDAAITLCQNTNSPTARMIEKGIQRIGRPLNDVTSAVENVGKLEVSKLEKGLPILATIAGGAPMIGFLGTVMGMIRAFYDMANASGGINVELLSRGIYTALVTTVAGLIVGIISYFAYNYLVAKVEKVVFNLEAGTTDFMDLLNEPIG
jgi:biopolymer transport protein ExbB